MTRGMNAMLSTMSERSELHQDSIALSYSEARLVRHYIQHLGRWLDYTDVARQFTLEVPKRLLQCPILHYAVQSFAAHHRRSEERRVGKEWRSRWAPYQLKEKT